MTNLLQIDKDTADSIKVLIEATTNSIYDINTLINKYGDDIPQFILNEKECMRKKLEMYNKINTYASDNLRNKSPTDNSSMFENNKIMSVPPPIFHKKPSNKLQLNISRSEQSDSSFSPINYSSYAGSPSRTSVTVSLADYMPQKNINNFENLIFVQLYPDQYAIVTAFKGISIRNLLQDIMKNHNYIYEQNNLIYQKNKEIIPWGIDSSNLSMSSIVVIAKDKIAEFQSSDRNHNYVKHTWMIPAYCFLCHKLVRKGAKCWKCHASLHNHCLLSISPKHLCPGQPSKKNNGKNIEQEMIELFNRSHPASQPNETARKYYFDRNISDEDHKITESKNYTLKELLQTVEQFENSKYNVKNCAITRENDDGHNKLVRTKAIQRSNSFIDWAINANEITMGPMVGSGTYGTVYKARWHGDVAVKMLKVKRPDNEQLEAFKNEVSMLRLCRHNNIILFMGCIHEPVLGIVTQWCDGNTLYKHIHVMDSDFDQKLICNFSHQIAEGMDYLHDKGIIHRDLKSNNIFLVEQHLIKIGDFGLATVKRAAVVSTADNVLQPTGSVLWMAPEIIRMKEKNPYSFKSDVYSYGIVLYEMISYSLPYPHISNIDTILYMVGKGTLKPDMSIILDTANLKLVKLCEKCIEYNPDLRPTFHEIVSIVSQAFYIVPIIARTTSCLHLKAESDLNVSQTSINMIKNSYLIPSYVNNLREAHSDHNINRKSQEDLNKKII